MDSPGRRRFTSASSHENIADEKVSKPNAADSVRASSEDKLSYVRTRDEPLEVRSSMERSAWEASYDNSTRSAELFPNRRREYGFYEERGNQPDDLLFTRNPTRSHSNKDSYHNKGHGIDEKYMAVVGDVGFSVLSSITQRLLIHPCLAFRNQCQVSNRLERNYILFPWSPALPLYNIYKNQGLLAVWKGVHNDLIISAFSKAVEVFVSENSSLPMKVSDSKSSLFSSYAKHMLLKTISTVVTTPLICAGYVLRVQSQVVVAEINYLAIFSDAYQRLLSTLFSYNTETSHLLPLYQLVFPITTLYLGRYLIQTMALATVQRQYSMDSITVHGDEHDEIPVIKNVYDKYYPQLVGALSGNLLADIFLYPLATVTGRLIVQGTRTIIDDVETGNAVLPVTSTYTGVINCCNTILKEEGLLGLYKGFGALTMQYLIQAMLLRGIHLLYEKVMDTHYPRVPRQKIYSVTPQGSTTSLH